MSRAELLNQLQGRPDIVLLMQEVQVLLNREQNKRKEFRNLIHENIKAEFINGEVVMHSPVKRKHWRVSIKLASLLNSYVDENDLGEVGSEKVMIGLTRNDYEPDIVFFNKEKAASFTPDQLIFPAPDFVVEILSESTERYDRNQKFIDYAAHQVNEYWIVDPDALTVEQYINKNGTFELFQKLHQGGITSITVKGFSVELKDIF
jgi:Uma2 family endonuclease